MTTLRPIPLKHKITLFYEPPKKSRWFIFLVNFYATYVVINNVNKLNEV